ncbi:enoyl-CoA hydratase-related protein [Falsiroseomonas sp. CW058]|uniref:enoyl-CoA hydratase-related protein n=1 Tax=Falsiroseomonas sp. CW058 TaxID=3388664 RepID=UPI003D323136
MTSRIRVEENGPLLEITFDHPPAHAFDQQACRDLDAAFGRLCDAPGLRCGIVTATGDRIFSAGWDLKAVAAGDRGEDFGPNGFMGLRRQFTRPVIAAVNGLAVGGGFEFALHAHMVVCAPESEFGLPELQRGFLPEAGGLWRVFRRLPRSIANELLLTGRRLTAEEGLRLGFVNRIVPRAALMDAAREMALRVAASAPLAVEALLEIAREAEVLPDAQAFALFQAGLPAHRRMRGSADYYEGPRAFAEKRPPRWTGS